MEAGHLAYCGSIECTGSGEGCAGSGEDGSGDNTGIREQTEMGSVLEVRSVKVFMSG